MMWSQDKNHYLACVSVKDHVCACVYVCVYLGASKVVMAGHVCVGSRVCIHVTVCAYVGAGIRVACCCWGT
jgi:hypothetical protein